LNPQSKEGSILICNATVGKLGLGHSRITVIKREWYKIEIAEVLIWNIHNVPATIHNADANNIWPQFGTCLDVMYHAYVMCSIIACIKEFTKL